MIDEMSGVTSALVKTALDGLAMQQRVIANNIANANSTGYVAQSMEFEAALRAAAQRHGDESTADVKGRLQQLSAAIGNGELVRETENAGVKLDIEMALLNQTVLKYQALVQGMGQFGSLRAMAISGEIK